MAYHGVALDCAIRKLNFEFKGALKRKGGNGIKTLKILFNKMDFNGNKKLDIEEFEEALNSFG
jgi:hypothetical protein